ncbi:uncharacterized protein LOC117314828 [Pecten maximus]|uniref:uncharacterized protein LOC117314828 n=1 Tax=Pecten maximus TaxID=6579 RepID=UPI0014589070|nr:uncharacterized protein LOC117314828 [Pecten maximus]
MKIEKDQNNAMLRMTPYTLDQDLHTCIRLPVPGDSPSSLWLRLTRLSLFGVTSKRFIVSTTGEAIECTRIGQKSLLVGVSGPSNNARCNIDSDMVFCKLVSNNTVNALNQCDLECECQSLSQCSDVHIIMKSNNKDDWSLCEVSMKDV